MKSANELQRQLRSIDRKSYPAYKGVQGEYQFGDYVLSIDHVQGDPFASPSKVSIHIEGKKAAFPADFYDEPYKRVAMQDHLTRLFYQKINQFNFKAKGSGKSGLLSVSRCGQEILERTACEIKKTDGSLTVRFEVGFPANGRTINASQLIKILFEFLPECAMRTLYYKNINKQKAAETIKLAEDQEYIRRVLPEMGLAAFVANGAILPRESGVSARPMKQAVPFASPASYEVSLTLPHAGTISGMGIPRGITLIVGGGYHGKSTLLKALEMGVYNHISGDGREYVITDAAAMKIRAEDGRSIRKTDISLFINNLPNKKNTIAFETEDASGSTSQAANVIEAMESGTSLFLIDEDTCATNFMIRDELMQRVVHREQEPITPFIERVRPLYEKEGISAIIVAGSSGSYFHVADHIIQMDQYKPKDITDLARKEARAFPQPEKMKEMEWYPSYQRVPRPNPEIKNNSRVKMKTLGDDSLSINRETVELRYLEQLADREQTTALGYILLYAEKNLFDGKSSLQDIVARIRRILDDQGLAAVSGGRLVPVNLAMPRDQEIYACFNRYRSIKL